MPNYAFSIQSALLATLIVAGCAGVQPPTSPDAVYGGRPGYVLGYLPVDELPDMRTVLPLPPQPGSAAFAADEEAYAATRKLRGTPRWELAARDADLTFPNATRVFSCVLDIPISEQATPHLNILLRRIRSDASRVNDLPKALYKRQRPYLAHGDTSCTPDEKHKNDSYPSGHTSIGWAWALVLAELAPERAGAILDRGYRFGESRVICGVHWKSDTDAGRLVGASTVSRLHADPVFVAQMQLARKEIEAARLAGSKSPLDCKAEADVLAARW